MTLNHNRIAHVLVLMFSLAGGAPAIASAQEGSLILGFSRPTITFTGPRGAVTTSASGFLVGGSVGSSTNRAAGVEFDGLFVTNGTDTPQAFTLRLSYLDLAVLGRINAPLNRDVRLHGYAGPQVGVLVHTSGAPEILASSDANHISRGDTSVVVGAGLDWRGRVVDVRYTRGLNDLTSATLFGQGVIGRAQSLAVLFSFRVK